MSFQKKTRCGIAVIVLTATLGLSLSVPRPARAIFGIADITFNTEVGLTPSSPNFWEKWLLKPAIHIVTRLALQAITQQVVGWINGDAKNTGFIGNFEKGLRNELDVRAGQYLNELAGVNLCGNFKLSLLLSLQTPSGGLQRKLGCTLTGIADNATRFFEDFQNGSWNNFLEIGIRPQNNPFGAYAIAYDAKLQAESSRGRALNKEVAAGSPFKGFQIDEEKCEIVTRRIGENPGAEFAGKSTENPSPEFFSGGTPGDTQRVCYTEKKVTTPGGAIAHSLNKSLDFSIDYGVNAKDWDDAIGAIVGALVNRLTQGANGLLNPRDGGEDDFANLYPLEVGNTKPQLVSAIDNGLANASVIVASIDQDIITISRQLEVEHQTFLARRATNFQETPSAQAIALQNNLTSLIDQRQRVLVAEADLLRAKSAATTAVTNQDITYTASLVAPSIQAINTAAIVTNASVTSTPLTGNTRTDALALFNDTLDNLTQAEATLKELDRQIGPAITANLNSIITLQAQEASLPISAATAGQRVIISNAIAVAQANISGLNQQNPHSMML
ncbi:MAG: hypothetical protein U1A26_01025 [Candidatus Sungbacteria bacterium]|nr:hypothetical protein [Candidatus Sungbacteria bacterium]